MTSIMDTLIIISLLPFHPGCTPKSLARYDGSLALFIHTSGDALHATEGYTACIQVVTFWYHWAGEHRIFSLVVRASSSLIEILALAGVASPAEMLVLGVGTYTCKKIPSQHEMASLGAYPTPSPRDDDAPWATARSRCSRALASSRSASTSSALWAWMFCASLSRNIACSFSAALPTCRPPAPVAPAWWWPVVSC